jgi:hypothetical protein
MKTLLCIAVVAALVYCLQINGLARSIKTLVFRKLRCCIPDEECSNEEVASCRHSAGINGGCLVNTVGCCAEATSSATSVRSSVGGYSSQFLQYPVSLDSVLSPEEEVRNEKVRINGEGILSTWLDKVEASDHTELAKDIPQASGEIAKVWSVCSECLNTQIESCVMTTALDAPSKTYKPSSDIFHAADTYDCLLDTTNGCCADEEGPRRSQIKSRSSHH